MFPFFVSSLRSPCYRPPSRPGHDFSLFLQIRVFSNHCMITSNDRGGDAKVLECLRWCVGDNKEFPLVSDQQYIFTQTPAWPRFLTRVRSIALNPTNTLWVEKRGYPAVSSMLGLNNGWTSLSYLWVDNKESPICRLGFTKVLENVCISQLLCFIFHVRCFLWGMIRWPSCYFMEMADTQITLCCWLQV